MAKFRKKPVVIEAMQYTGENATEIQRFIGAAETDESFLRPTILKIKTLEGTMQADEGDWIIRGVKGEFYPCKPDIFSATYEAVEG